MTFILQSSSSSYQKWQKQQPPTTTTTSPRTRSNNLYSSMLRPFFLTTFLYCLFLFQTPVKVTAAAANANANEAEEERPPGGGGGGGRMTLSQFQSILHTFVDDEIMAHVADSTFQYESEGGDSTTRTSSHSSSSSSSSGAGAIGNSLVLDMMLKSHVANMDQLEIVMTEVVQGQHLNRHHGRKLHRRRHQQRQHERNMQRRRQLSGRRTKEEEGITTTTTMMMNGGRCDAEEAWESIVSHAWDMTRISHSSVDDDDGSTSPQYQGQDHDATIAESGTAGRRRVEEGVEEEEETQSRSGASNDHRDEDGMLLLEQLIDDDAPPNEEEEEEDDETTGEEAFSNNNHHGIITLDGNVEEETDTPWSTENEALFLVCHNSTSSTSSKHRSSMSGNDHLKAILARAGKDHVGVQDYFDNDNNKKNNGKDGGTRPSVADNGSDYNIMEVVHSSPNLVCVVTSMKPTYAEAIANNRRVAQVEEPETNTFIMTIVPWVDVMKISPELFGHLVLLSSTSIDDDDDDDDAQEEEEEDANDARHGPSLRGLRNFRSRSAAREENDPTIEYHDDASVNDFMWESSSSERQQQQGTSNTVDAIMEHQHIIFSLIPSSNAMGDAMNVIEGLIEMAKNGQEQRRRRRRRLEEEEEEEQSKDDSENESRGQRRHGRRLREMSIRDAFSITSQAGRGESSSRSTSSSSHRRWSNILSRGLESSSDYDPHADNHNSCISILENIELEPSFDSSYEFPLVSSSSAGGDNSNAALSIPTPECIASIIAGLSIHPHILHVGIISNTVQLDNVNAQSIVQGGVVQTNTNGQTTTTTTTATNTRPFFHAGLNGSGQIVSVSDTGLDVDNCYFKDEPSSVTPRGGGSIFHEWDYTHRKVVRYEISNRGGDTSDTQRGHGTHVVGTVAGRHALLDNGEGGESYGNDSKEGIAPGAKIHFYDIGQGYVVTDPRGGWFDSFTRQDNPNRKGAKIGTGSWGFGYRDSYDWVCRLYDQMLIDHPDVLFVSSAGNTGNKFDSPYNTIGAPASCKNVFAVGATNSVGYGSHGLGHVVDFSSRGPTADGRTKPDVLAPGYALNSALSYSDSGGDCSKKEDSYLKAGTSMSAPVIAGVGAIVRQYFEEGWYPCGSKGCGPSIDPSGTLVKSVIANGAKATRGVQVGGSSTILDEDVVKPYDNIQNMGEASLLSSLPLPGENDFNIFVVNDSPLKHGEEMVRYFTLDLSEDCASDLSATLTWYDPPGSSGCTKCLMNDLDLSIENTSSSERYHPNGRSEPDTINNMERVRIPKMNTAVGGRYKVSVKASMLGPGYTTQNFSLAMTGCFSSVSEQPPEPEEPDEPATPQNHELTTTYQANRKQAGNMFAIKAKEGGVDITSFAIHTLVDGRKVKLHVYTLNNPGGLTGNEAFLNDPSRWTRISPSAGIEVQAMGFNSPTLIPLLDPVPIANGMTQSFYISFIDEPEMLYKAVDNDYPTGAVYASDENIDIMTGVGKMVNFGVNWQSRQMNGAVFYSPQNLTPTPSPTPSPTPPPTHIPTKLPTEQPTTRQPTKRPVSKPTLPLFMELETTYAANKKQAGNMFDVIAKQDVAISSFKIHTLLTGNSVPVTLYSKLGSWENFDKDPSAWDMIGTVSVDCKGYGQPTIVSGSDPIWIDSGSTRAFYLTFDEPELLYHQSAEYPSGEIYAQDSAIQIKTGIGKAGRFGASYLSRQLNGALIYYLT